MIIGYESKSTGLLPLHVLSKYEEFGDCMDFGSCCTRNTRFRKAIGQVLLKCMPIDAQIKPFFNKKDLLFRVLSNDGEHCVCEAELWNIKRWLSLFLDLTVDELVRKIQENRCPSKTVTLDGELLEFFPAFQSYDAGGIILLRFVDLLNAYPSAYKWISSLLKLDLPGMSGLEGAPAHQGVRKVGIEGTFTDLDIGIIDIKMLFRKTIWTVGGEGYFIEVTLKRPFIHLSRQN